MSYPPQQPYHPPAPNGYAPDGHQTYRPAPYPQAPYGQAPYGQAPYPQAPYGYGRPVERVITCRFCGSTPARNATVFEHHGMLVLMSMISLKGPPTAAITGWQPSRA